MMGSEFGWSFARVPTFGLAEDLQFELSRGSSLCGNLV